MRSVLRFLSLLALAAAATAHSPAPLAAGAEGGLYREITASELPPEARETLARIKTGGPFPYERDGAAFGNRERLLPLKGRGYYREYTVRTPGTRDRGARRIVAGGCTGGAARPSAAGGTAGSAHLVAACDGGEYYYTDDHYRTFRRIREAGG